MANSRGDWVKRINHGNYRLVCDPENGGQVAELTWRGEHLLRPSSSDARDPLHSACFPLVPFSNRIAGDLPTVGGDIELPKAMQGEPFAIHGFGWQRSWLVASHAEARIELEFEDNGKHWPSPYKARQLFELTDDGAQITIAVQNCGDMAMPAGIGLHPYFPRGDCRLRINAGQIWEQDTRGLPQAASSDHPLASADAVMREIRLDHSFSGWDGRAKLEWPGRQLSLTLCSGETLRELVIYSPEEDFFCIEPVSHLTNAALATSPAMRQGWRELAPGEELAGTMTLTAQPLDPSRQDLCTV